MGTNRRYADKIDAQMKRRITEMLLRPKPVTLTDAELDIENDPVTRADRPVRVRAWVRYPEPVARLEGRAVAWTTRAVKLQWETADGERREAWVWASAVDRI
ncbi:hypothetical protein SAMN04487846_3568 [Microbacterium sp. cf046]|nr:hypothetical protein SAMN04487846_3568 [Microbacterium sp. cf046]